MSGDVVRSSGASCWALVALHKGEPLYKANLLRPLTGVVQDRTCATARQYVLHSSRTDTNSTARQSE